MAPFYRVRSRESKVVVVVVLQARLSIWKTRNLCVAVRVRRRIVTVSRAGALGVVYEVAGDMEATRSVNPSSLVPSQRLLEGLLSAWRRLVEVTVLLAVRGRSASPVWREKQTLSSSDTFQDHRLETLAHQPIRSVNLYCFSSFYKSINDYITFVS